MDSASVNLSAAPRGWYGFDRWMETATILFAMATA